MFWPGPQLELVSWFKSLDARELAQDFLTTKHSLKFKIWSSSLIVSSLFTRLRQKQGYVFRESRKIEAVGTHRKPAVYGPH